MTNDECRPGALPWSRRWELVSAASIFDGWSAAFAADNLSAHAEAMLVFLIAVAFSRFAWFHFK